MTTVIKSQGRRLRTIAYFDQIIFAADFFGKSQITAPDRIVALGILHFTNLKAGATYIDLLTLAQRLDIKYSTVKTAARHLVECGHLKITKRPGKTPLLIPILKGCEEHSTRGDKGFYRARGKLIAELVFDRRLTPAERLAGLAFLATVDPETCECASQLYVARTCGLSRDKLYKRALPKLETLSYIARTKAGTIVFDLAVDVGGEASGEALGEALGEASMCDKARQMGVSHRNSIDSYNSDDSVTDQEGNDSVIGDNQASLVIKLPDPAAVSLWRRNVYAFLTVGGGPTGMIHPIEMAAFIESGLLVHNGEHLEISALGHAIGAPTTMLRQEAIAA